MKAAFAAAKLKNGPSKNTRSQTEKYENEVAKKGSTERIKSEVKKPVILNQESPSCDMSISNGLKSFEVAGRCDDVSNESLISTTIAEKAIPQGIGFIQTIDSVVLQVALKKAQKHNLSNVHALGLPHVR